MLRLFLLGGPRIEQGGQAVPLRRSKALALLVYLATTRQPQDRNTLLALLWPEFDLDSARNNLRRELSLLKTTLGAEVLIVDRFQVAWNPRIDAWLDVAAFQGQIASWNKHGHATGALCAGCAAALTTAVQLYTDDFLTGFCLPDSQAFEEWQFFQREELRHQLAEALHALAGWHSAGGAYSAALALARRWLALDPLHEPAQRELMRLYALAGQHSAALRQFEESARLLDKELGVAPEAETADLYDAIRTRQFAVAPRAAAQAPALPGDAGSFAVPEAPHQAARAVHTLLQQARPFVGRERELKQIAEHLADPACRLLTLIGPGGVGKTRLALEAANRGQAAFADGCAFVPLQPVSAASFLVSAIAEALQIPLQSQHNPLAQLCNILRDKQLLLVLDNLEQLLDGVDCIGVLLAQAPRLTILATSREVLNLQEEWLYPLEGLKPPASESPNAIEVSSAVQLFVERAQQVRRDFSLAAERSAVMRICRLVEGLPLAIELAATWTRTLSCATIADEIARNLAFLETNLRNVPVRHRSVQAAFDQSWALLAEPERNVFARLAVFQCGFTRAAAEQVADATLGELTALVDKSLVQREANGRYQMHELLRQYAEGRLAASPDQQAGARQAHAAYYVAFLGARLSALIAGDQRAAIDEIAVELQDIRTMWGHIIAHGDVIAIRQAAHPLALYYIFRGPYHEGATALEQAANRLRGAGADRPRQIALAGMLVDLAWLYLRLGRLGEARLALEESQALYAELGMPPPPGRATDPLLVLADLAMIAGDFATAARYGDQARRRSEAHGQITNLPYAWYALTEAALAQGLYDLAQQYAQNAYRAVQVSRDRWYAAYLHSELGHVAVARAAYAEARQHYRASYLLREEFGDPQGMAEALGHLGRVAALQHAYDEATQIYQQICDIYRRTGDRGGLARALNGLGQAACRAGDLAAAHRSLHQAFLIAADLRFTTLILIVLSSVAELLLLAGQPDLAVGLLVLILRNPASDRETGDCAQALLLRAEGMAAPDMFAAAIGRAQRMDLDVAITSVQAALAAPLGPPLTLAGAEPAALATAGPGLANDAHSRCDTPYAEALTTREQEVLSLIAAGLSNRAIAERLVLSIGTVKWYVDQIYAKLGVHSRTQALARARELTLLVG
jgi:predicted ATPase/DNA-binding SARP family transcriptional activator/DNA-binding CsgD family transcriptional regulator